MAEPEADVLIVDDQPYSSGGSNNEDYEPIQNENDKIEPTQEIPNSKPEKKKKKPKKSSEPVFIPVISGTATIDSERADSEIHTQRNISNPTEAKDQMSTQNTDDPNVKEKSKCCLLI